MSEIFHERLQHPLPHTLIPVDDEIELSQLFLGQAAQLYDLVDQQRPYLAEYLPWAESTKSPEDTLSFLESIYLGREAGTEYGFGIFFKGELAGHISLMHLNEDDCDPEIGYWVSQTVSRQGIMTRVVQALTKFGFEELKLNRIIIQAAPSNIGSNRVAEKNGYQLTSQSAPGAGQEPINRWAIQRLI